MMSPDQLYQLPPTTTYLAPDGYTWYACYDDQLSILTNADGCLAVYSYPDKTEFRGVRRTIVNDYGLFVVDDLDDE